MEIFFLGIKIHFLGTKIYFFGMKKNGHAIYKKRGEGLPSPLLKLIITLPIPSCRSPNKCLQVR